MPARRHRLHQRPHRIARAQLERSEEHTSELQSQSNLVCRLLLEKKKKMNGRCSSVSLQAAGPVAPAPRSWRVRADASLTAAIGHDPPTATSSRSWSKQHVDSTTG